MKMEEKGISTALIVGIVVTVVVVVVVVAVVAVVLLKPGAGAGVGNLPLYGGASKADTVAGIGTSSNFVSGIVGKGQSAPSGVQAEVYTATGDVDEILNYYRTEMTNAGWTKQYEDTFSYSYTGVSMTVGVLYFEKGDRAATVCAALYTYQGETYTYFGLMEGPKITFEGWMSGAGYEWEEETTTTPWTTTTTTPITTTTPTTTTPTTTPGGGIETATSLAFDVDVTSEGTTSTMTFKAKDIGTNNMKIRMEGTILVDETTQDYIVIANGELQKAWMYTGGVWMDMSDYFSEYWEDWAGSFEGYTGELSGWTGGDYTYTYGGTTVRIYNIVLNPVLEDSLFVHSG
jgi:hypothetical protein